MCLFIYLYGKLRWKTSFVQSNNEIKSIIIYLERSGKVVDLFQDEIVFIVNMLWKSDTYKNLFKRLYDLSYFGQGFVLIALQGQETLRQVFYQGFFVLPDIVNADIDDLLRACGELI